MAKSLMLLLALVALSVPAAAEEPKVCGAPVALKDGWTLAAQAEVGLDAAKLGRLMLTDGQWNGRQVVPAGWAIESIKPHINGEGLFF